MKTISILPLLLLMTMASCKKDQPNTTAPIDGEVQLNSLKVGQTSMYERLSGACSLNDNTLTLDTLVLEVVQSIDGTLLLKETYTSGSANYANLEAVQYPVSDQGTHLLVPDRSMSALFFFYANDTIWKDPAIDVELDKEDCQMTYPNGDPFIGNEIGFVEELDLGLGIKRNLKVISCEPFFELDAYLTYDKRYLENSVVLYADWGGGFQLEAWSRIQ